MPDDLTKTPMFVPWWYADAYAHLKRAECATAIEVMRAAAAQDPLLATPAHPALLRGADALRAGQVARAIDDFAAAVRDAGSPGSSEAHRMLGVAYWLSGGTRAQHRTPGTGRSPEPEGRARASHARPRAGRERRHRTGGTDAGGDRGGDSFVCESPFPSRTTLCARPTARKMRCASTRRRSVSACSRAKRRCFWISGPFTIGSSTRGARRRRSPERSR